MSNRIREMIIDGYSVSDICLDINLKKSSVYKLIEEKNLSHLLKAKNKKALEMLKMGYLINEVESETGVSKKTIYRLIAQIENFVPFSKRSKMSDEWVNNVYKDIDRIVSSFIGKNISLNVDYDDAKGEVLDFILKINRRYDIKNKENYFRMSVFKELNKYKRELIEKQNKTYALINTDGEVIDIPIFFNLDYAIDELSSLKI